MDWVDPAQDLDRRWAYFECGNEPPGAIKCGKFLHNLLEEDAAPCR